LQDLRTVATIFCMKPACAPNGTAVAYEHHFPVGEQRELVGPSLGLLALSSDVPHEHEIWPIGLANNKESDGTVHMLVSPILWFPDSSGLVFFDRVGYYGECRGSRAFLTTLRFPAGFKKPTATQSYVNPMDYAAVGAPVDEMCFGPRTVQWLGSKHLTGRLNQNNWWRDGTFAMDLNGKRIEKTDAADADSPQEPSVSPATAHAESVASEPDKSASSNPRQ